MPILMRGLLIYDSAFSLLLQAAFHKSSGKSQASKTTSPWNSHWPYVMDCAFRQGAAVSPATPLKGRPEMRACLLS